MFYFYTFLYFFLVKKSGDQRTIKCLGASFTALNVIMFLAGIWGFYVTTSFINCRDKDAGAYGTTVASLNVFGILAGIIEVVMAGVFFSSYRSSGQVPIFGGSRGKMPPQN